MNPVPPTTIESLVRDARNLFDRSVEVIELEGARRCLIDSLGCGIAGAQEPLIQHLLAQSTTVSASSDDASGLVFGSKRPVMAVDGLLINATAIRVFDFNDVYSGRNNHHPSESVVPLCLAEAERQDWTGRELLDAIARSYRVSLTVGEIWSGLLQKGWAPAATLGHLSNALLIGLLRGQERRVVEHALAISIVSSPTLAVVFKGGISDVKNMVSGLSLQTAWRAHSLAQAGVSGPLNAVEGTAGFAEQIGGEGLPFNEASELSLGAHSVSLKPYPAIFTVHAAVEAGVRVRSDLGWKAGEPVFWEGARISVEVPEKVATMAAAANRWNPPTVEDAQFSLPHCLAVTLGFGELSIASLRQSFSAEFRSDIERLRQSVDVVSVDSWDGYIGARLTVEHNDKSAFAEVLEPSGSPGNPFSDGQVSLKFVNLTQGILGQDGAESALEQLTTLESVDSPRALFGHLFSSAGSQGGNP